MNSKLLEVKSGAPLRMASAPVAKAFVCSIFIEVEPTLLFVVRSRSLTCKFLLDCLLGLFPKGGRAVDAEAVGIDF